MGPLIDVTALAQALAGEDRPAVLDVRWRVGGPPGIGDYWAATCPALPSSTWTTIRPPRPGQVAAIRCPGPGPTRPPCGGPAYGTGAPWSSTTRTTPWRRPGHGGHCATSATSRCGSWTAG